MADISDLVLIVDDDPLIRELLESWLDRGGYPTVCAVDAETAVQLLTSENIGVALCDQTMPGRGGEWLVGQIRERFPTVAVILATGADVPPRVSLQPGVVGHLHKPFGRAIVLEAVANASLWHQVASRAR
jgi:CheY-like chemotaxis protein